MAEDVEWEVYRTSEPAVVGKKGINKRENLLCMYNKNKSEQKKK